MTDDIKKLLESFSTMEGPEDSYAASLRTAADEIYALHAETPDGYLEDAMATWWADLNELIESEQ